MLRHLINSVSHSSSIANRLARVQRSPYLQVRSFAAQAKVEKAPTGKSAKNILKAEKEARHLYVPRGRKPKKPLTAWSSQVKYDTEKLIKIKSFFGFREMKLHQYDRHMVCVEGLGYTFSRTDKFDEMKVIEYFSRFGPVERLERPLRGKNTNKVIVVFFNVEDANKCKLARGGRLSNPEWGKIMYTSNWCKVLNEFWKLPPALPLIMLSHLHGNDEKINRSVWCLEMLTPSTPPQSVPNLMNSKCYIENIRENTLRDDGTVERELREHASKAGEVEELKVHFYEYADVPRCAFLVTFKTAESAKKFRSYTRGKKHPPAINGSQFKVSLCKSAYIDGLFRKRFQKVSDDYREELRAKFSASRLRPRDDYGKFRKNFQYRLTAYRRNSYEMDKLRRHFVDRVKANLTDRRLREIINSGEAMATNANGEIDEEKLERVRPMPIALTWALHQSWTPHSADVKDPLTRNETRKVFLRADLNEVKMSDDEWARFREIVASRWDPIEKCVHFRSDKYPLRVQNQKHCVDMLQKALEYSMMPHRFLQDSEEAMAGNVYPSAIPHNVRNQVKIAKQAAKRAKKLAILQDALDVQMAQKVVKTTVSGSKDLDDDDFDAMISSGGESEDDK